MPGKKVKGKPMLVKGKNFSLDGIGRILLIQLGDIGDVVLTTPTIKALKENHPSGEIFVLLRSHAGELLEGCPWVDGVICVNKEKRKFTENIAYQKNFLLGLRRKRFELAIDLRAGTRGAIASFLSGARLRVGRYRGDKRLWRNRLFTHLIRPENELRQYSALHSLNILAPFELRIKNTSPELIVTEEKERSAANILRKEKVLPDKLLIALHPFSRWRYKEWPIRNYIRLINHMGIRYKVSILITGSIDERDRVSDIAKSSKIDVHNLAGKTSLGELAAILKKCRLLIGIDSAPIHIAAAVGTPTITIFGPSSPINWAPQGKHHYVIYKDLPCVPCRQKGCNNSEVSRCLDELSVEEVIPVVDTKFLEMETTLSQ
jgi:predicted lipopolysaccharide heptosyltransferase III